MRPPSLIAGDKTAEEAAGQIGVSVPTYHRWKEQYGGADQNTVNRLKELEKENSRLKKLVADQALDTAMLKELVEGAERSETDTGAAFARRASRGGESKW